MRIHQRQLAMRGHRLNIEIRAPYLPPDRPDWFTDSRRKCAPTGPGPEGINRLFTSEEQADLHEAAKLCRKCPFEQECAAWAVQHDERHFVWGGHRRITKKPRPGDAIPADTPDETLIARSLGGNGSYFGKLTDEQKRVVIRGALDRDYTWARMAQELKTGIVVLRALHGDSDVARDDLVRQLYAAGRTDVEIAAIVRLSRTGVGKIRARLNLPSQFGPGGKAAGDPVTPQERQAEMAELKKTVHSLYQANLSDGQIAARLGKTVGSIQYVRSRLGLPSKFGKGRPRRAGAAA